MSIPSVKLRRYLPDDLEWVSELIARLNEQPESHVADFDTRAGAVARYLQELNAPPEESFVLAVERGRLVGALGLEWDEELGQGWLQGPMIDHRQWHEVADALMVALLERVPPWLGMITLGTDVRNDRAHAFAGRHGFRRNPYDNLLLTLPRPGLSAPVPAEVEPLSPALAAELSLLHDALFPEGHYDGAGLARRVGDRFAVFVYRDAEGLAGYCTIANQSESRETYIDFIGVAERARRRGIASALLAAVSRWSFAIHGVDRVALTVRTNRPGAVALYRRLGFQELRTLCGHRLVLGDGGASDG